jgi:histidine ammonia-lyase
LLRQHCAAMPTDRHLAPDIAAATALVQRGDLSTMFRSLPDLPALWVAS